MIQISVSLGEALDRLTILEIKSRKLTKPVELDLVTEEHSRLAQEITRAFPDWEDKIPKTVFSDLLEVNLQMWDSMQNIYDSEDFTEATTALTIQIIEVNKRRAYIKREIDSLINSKSRESKSFF